MNSSIAKKPKAFFIISSIPQSDIFNYIVKELPAWSILGINVGQWDEWQKIDKYLQYLNFPHINMSPSRPYNIGELFFKEKPNIVITGNDTIIMSQQFIKTANILNIPTLLIQDGILDFNNFDNFNKHNKIGLSIKYLSKLPNKIISFIFNPHFSQQYKLKLISNKLNFLLTKDLKYAGGVCIGHGDCLKIAVFGNETRKGLLSEGVNDNKIVLTGSPKSDIIFHFKNLNCKKKVCNLLNIPDEKKIILILTQYFVEAGIWSIDQRREFILAIFEATQKIKNTQLIIKIHPSYETEENYLKIFEDKLINPPIICSNFSLYELLNCSDLVITVSSTAGLEAMQMGKHLLIVDLFRTPGTKRLFEKGALYVDQKEEIAFLIENILYDKSKDLKLNEQTDNYVFSQLFLQDGNSSKRISKLIEDMVD